MLVSIGTYALCNGTLLGGVAISALRLTDNRVYDVVIPLRDVAPVPIDRINRTTELSFTIKRTFNSLADCEKFILTLDGNVPETGDVTITTSDPSPVTVTIPNSAVLSHE